MTLIWEEFVKIFLKIQTAPCANWDKSYEKINRKN